MSEIKKVELVDEMLDFLIKESGIKPNFDYLKLDKRKLLNNLLVLNLTENLGNYFYSLQDQLLRDENRDYKNVASINFKGNIAYVNADCTSINADVVVHFSTNLIPMKMQEDMDSKVLLKAGAQLGYEYYKALKENGFAPNYNKPYISDAYNLPAENIAKVLLGGNAIENIKQIFNFTVKNDLVTIFFDLTNADVSVEEIAKIKPKSVKLIFNK